MLQSLLFVSALAAATIAQSTCSTRADPQYTPRSKKFVCGKQGLASNGVASRTFAAENDEPADCASECISDASCNSFSFNTESGMCTTYIKPVREMGFRQQADTGEYFYYKQCFIKSGDCGIANGNFEGGAEDDGAGSFPEAYLPWVFVTNDGTGQSMGQLVNGNPFQGKYFEIENYGNSTSFIGQRVTLTNGTTYNLRFDYGKLFANRTSGGDVVVTYAGQTIFRQSLAERGNGFYVGTVNFTSVNVPDVDGTKLLNIGVIGQSNSTANASVARVAFDGIKLTRL